ncbi:hypothetical protein [Sinanaerobacter chloroacetimidivorans]|uniref:Uncharacterized protein n=1 Tax=Sinanaerobacter chloroacetimidivorans TaxID=2818044 RepID=A0A8J7W0E1_9FIRM|nr:hypothetical protein [Sinanaerobacter chloroacetimidivorans]MBR0596940.1 hypothetical protein [Sinanaerobacter chloroacetimidivorans]
MDKNNFDNKENLGHGIKGDVSNAKNLKDEKNNKNNKVNNLRSDKNFEN